MHWHPTPYAVPLFIGAGILFVLAALTFRSRTTPKGRYLIAVCVASIFYVFGYAMEIGSAALDIVSFWLKIEYIGITLLPVLMYKMVSTYHPDYQGGLWNIFPLLVVPAITLALAWTNESHELIWGGLYISAIEPYTMLSFTPGAWYWVHIVYSFGMLAAGIWTLFRSLRQFVGLYRPQLRTLIIALMIPIIATIIYLLRILPTPIDIVPYSMIVTAAIIVWNTLYNQLADLTPIARETVFLNIKTPVLVFDRDYRIADLNPAAQSTLGITLEHVIKTNGLLPANLLRFIESDSDSGDIILHDIDNHERTFNVYRSPMSSKPGSIEGYVLVMHDITERKAVESALRESQHLLELFFTQSLDGFFFFMLDQPITWNDSADKDALIEYVLHHQRITRANDAIIEQYRVPREKFIGARPIDFAQSDDDLSGMRRLWRKLFDEGRLKIDYIRTQFGFSRSFTVEGDYVVMHNSEGQILGHFGVQRDVTERLKAAQLRQEKEVLEAAFRKEQELSGLKSRMMERITHEFRTPLAIISASSYLLGRHYERMTPEKRAEQLERIHASIEEFKSMLEDISYVTRLSDMPAGLLPIEFAPAEICKLAIEQAPKRYSAHQRFQLECRDPRQMVHADLRLFQQILDALMSNAIKFSPPQSIITVKIDITDDLLRVSVIDQGIGILPDEMARIFEPFFRGSNFDEIPGLGLGLTKAMQAAQAHHGGTIHVESTPGVGTTATMHLHLNNDQLIGLPTGQKHAEDHPER